MQYRIGFVQDFETLAVLPHNFYAPSDNEAPAQAQKEVERLKRKFGNDIAIREQWYKLNDAPVVKDQITVMRPRLAG